MGATVTLNGQTLGAVVDQFVRYVYPIPTSALLAGMKQILNEKHEI